MIYGIQSNGMNHTKRQIRGFWFHLPRIIGPRDSALKIGRRRAHGPSPTNTDHHQKSSIRTGQRGSPVSQSTVNTLHVSTSDLHMDLTCFDEIVEICNDTSWAEMFNNTSRIDAFHDTSWIMNSSLKFLDNDKVDDCPRYEVDNVPLTQRPFGRAIKFTPETTTSRGWA